MENVVSFSQWRRDRRAEEDELPPQGSYAFLMFAAGVCIAFYLAVLFGITY